MKFTLGCSFKMTIGNTEIEDDEPVYMLLSCEPCVGWRLLSPQMQHCVLPSMPAKVEAAVSYKIFVPSGKTVQQHIPKDSNLHSPCHEKSHI